MTDSNDDLSKSDLPSFTVNVAPVAEIRGHDLRALLERFRRGEIEPLIFGDDNTPEAAVIPFAAFVRLLKHDHAATVRDESELQRRIQESDASGDPGMTLDELGDELGEPARSLIRRALDDDE